MDEHFEERLRRALHGRAAQVQGSVNVLADVRRRARRQGRARRAGGGLALVVALGVGALAVEPLLSSPEVRLAPADDAADPDQGPPSTEAAEPRTTHDPDAAPRRGETCEGGEDEVAYRIHYPAGWWASGGSADEACRWFHPEPFDMAEAPRDVPEVAITVRVQRRPLDGARSLDRGQHDLLAEDETTVDGRRAVVQEYVLRVDGIYPEGTTVYRYLVDVGDRTLYATTADAYAADADHEDSRAALDAIMRTLEVLAAPDDGDAGTCSATHLDPRPEPQDGLPAPVTEMRAAILAAAVACDHERLAELAGDGFAYSFGGDGDFAAYLRRGEESGDEPLRHLVVLLNAPSATIEVGDAGHYVWPSAFAYDDWNEVPDIERDALEPLYDEDDFDNFHQFGAYTGYRVGITADGDWRFFVAGD